MTVATMRWPIPMHSLLSTTLATPLAVLLLFVLSDLASGKSKKMKNPSSEISLKQVDAAPKIVLDPHAKRRPSKKRANAQ